MPVRVVMFVWKPIVVHYFPADESFEREGGEHIEAEEETCDVDHEIISGEVVEYVAERFVAEGKVAR